MSKIEIVYARQKMPVSFKKSIFLAGPSPRHANVKSWRPLALKLLTEFGYDGVVFVPENDDVEVKFDYIDQVEWEEQALKMSDCILFWIPRNMSTLPGLTTNDEWGVWKNSGKAVLGVPNAAQKTKYQKYYAQKLAVPVHDTLEKTIRVAMEAVGTGKLRKKGERNIPLIIWNTKHYQDWYADLQKAGNELESASIEWSFRVGNERKFVLFWAIHADIYITKENRHKTNEVVISRPDISCIVAYKPDGEDYRKSKVVLIREFRSPCRSGFVWEIPGGSSFKPTAKIEETAGDELFEETGIKVSDVRVKYVGSRQIAASVVAHKAHIFSVELTDEEIDFADKTSDAFGNLHETELTHVEVFTVAELLEADWIDWTNMGMILSVVNC